MKFAIEAIWHYPSHRRHVVTLPSEVRNSNFLQILKKTQTNCTLIASNFVIHPQILILLVSKIANLSPQWLQIKFSMSVFTYLLLRSICGIGNSSQQTSLQCLSTINMVSRNEDKILIYKVCIWTGTQQRGWHTNFLGIAGQSMVLISCWKSCGTQEQLTRGQAAADRALKRK